MPIVTATRTFAILVSVNKGRTFTGRTFTMMASGLDAADIESFRNFVNGTEGRDFRIVADD